MLMFVGSAHTRWGAYPPDPISLDPPPLLCYHPPMPRSRHLLPLALALATAVLTPSCAYMQTHKNVKEMGRRYPGYQLQKPTQLYRARGQWFVAATPAEYRLSHDVVHDNVFRKSNEPQMKLVELTQQAPAYHAISEDTATVLLRSDGYADNAIIAREIEQMNAPWLPSLPQASVHQVKAQVVGEEQAAVTYAPSPAKPAWTYQLLSGLDFMVVDVPGTVVYNTAVPFIAPFVFFHEFLSE